MTTEDIKQVVIRFHDALNNGDAGTATDLWAPDATNHGRRVDRQMVQKLMEDIVKIHEHYQIEQMLAEGDWVACRVIVSGRHKARPLIPFDGGIYNLTEPTGRSFTTQHIHLYRIVDGKIKEHWANRDDLGAARQLGFELKPV